MPRRPRFIWLWFPVAKAKSQDSQVDRWWPTPHPEAGRRLILHFRTGCTTGTSESIFNVNVIRTNNTTCCEDRNYIDVKNMGLLFWFITKRLPSRCILSLFGTRHLHGRIRRPKVTNCLTSRALWCCSGLPSRYEVVTDEERQIAVVASNPFLVDFSTENRHSIDRLIDG